VDYKVESLSEIKLLEYLESNYSDCPICYMKIESIDKLIKDILYGMVNDPSIRKKLREKGICSKHSNQITDYLTKFPELGILGISIIMEDLLEYQASELFKNNRTIKKRKKKKYKISCYFCDIEKQYEMHYLKAFSSFLIKGNNIEIYGQSEAILCLKHTKKLLELIESKNPNLTILFEKQQRKKIEKTLLELKQLINKHDYRNKEPIGNEISSWKKALKILSE